MIKYVCGDFMTFKIITLGCKVNTYESEIMQEKLIDSGYYLTDEKADVVIVNTCSVTNMADSKSRKLIRSAKRENERCILVVCGCMAQNHQDDLKDLGIDILIGNKDKSKIVELIDNFKKTKNPYVKFYNNKNLEFEDMRVKRFRTHTRAFLKIQDGCNNYCSYCIIPYMRGNLRSKDINKAYEEVVELVDNGHKEIVLTGIHTGSYGIGLGYDLVDLIRKISKIEGLERIRISSIEITELNDKFMAELKNNAKICNHLHIPLQSGSARILKLMNRKYDKEYFKNIITNIRSIRSDISITTDVIVGFPSETEEDFEECVEFCKEIKFSKIHVFPYSRREGTKACEISGHLDNETKKRRARELIKVSNELEKMYYEKFIGKIVKVLIEENINGEAIGHTSNYLKVYINKELKCNENYDIMILELEKDGLKGMVIDDKGCK